MYIGCQVVTNNVTASLMCIGPRWKQHRCPKCSPTLAAPVYLRRLWTAQCTFDECVMVLMWRYGGSIRGIWVVLLSCAARDRHCGAFSLSTGGVKTDRGSVNVYLLLWAL